jgi:hypothetical protein
MYPASGPPKVYRFEGSQKVPQVALLIRQQVEVREEAREGGGYLFRFAKPKKQQGQGAARDPVAVRIFKTQAGETALDIWREKEYKKDLPNAALRAGIYGSSSKKARPVKYDDKAKAERRAALADTMKVLKKIQTGEPLTKEELTSGALH